MAEKKEALATATAKAAATLHALNLAKARLAALEATQPTDRTQRLNDSTTEPTTEPSKEPSTEPTAEEYTEEPADTEEDTDGGDVVTVVNTDEEPATKSAAKTPTLVTKLANTAPVAKAPAATAAQLPQTGEKDAKPGILAGILSLLAGVSLFGFSFEKRKQEK
ncbi:LPXTG cell wall anchor domain-containing protein [Lactobacillus delbrueckii subsp. bulgaricus]|uniref:LPXTG cell wall anchor domain-containing protein n=1 Tax=Lactobacillus delbrueckii TaxID=1584 RepID=UPI001E5BC341|nr:LPXTG cell wall anchor domain-containing protein [Lactobacillus delbrueckii]MCD5481521.1 LPXTG cell wall anchor domain-containing protein [Lactobacillus delbrueckii subsp. bulgaricus]